MLEPGYITHRISPTQFVADGPQQRVNGCWPPGSGGPSSLVLQRASVKGYEGERKSNTTYASLCTLSVTAVLCMQSGRECKSCCCEMGSLQSDYPSRPRYPPDIRSPSVLLRGLIRLNIGTKCRVPILRLTLPSPPLAEPLPQSESVVLPWFSHGSLYLRPLPSQVETWVVWS